MESSAYVCLMFGQALLALGSMPLYIFTFTYLDEIIPRPRLG